LKEIDFVIRNHHISDGVLLCLNALEWRGTYCIFMMSCCAIYSSQDRILVLGAVTSQRNVACKCIYTVNRKTHQNVFKEPSRFL